MQIASIELSTDSLIVATALAGVVPPRHMIPLAVLFGLFDGLASLVGPQLHVQIPNSELITPAVLILWGAFVTINLPIFRRFATSLGWAYALAPILAIDNLVVPDADWIVAGLTSGALAMLGFAIGSVIFRNRVASSLDRRWLGLPLAIAAGVLLVS